MRRVKMEYTITILGVPLQKQSARFARRGNFMMKYQPKQVTDWVAQARAQIISQLGEYLTPIKGDIRIKYLKFVFPPLKNWSKKKTRELAEGKEVFYKNNRPDLDNLMKMTFDVCNGVLWIDDAQIVCIENAEKEYGLVPMVKMCVEVLE